MSSTEYPDYVQDMEHVFKEEAFRFTAGEDGVMHIAYALRALVYQNERHLIMMDELEQQLVNINVNLDEVWRRVGNG